MRTNVRVTKQALIGTSPIVTCNVQPKLSAQLFQLSFDLSHNFDVDDHGKG